MISSPRTALGLPATLLLVVLASGPVAAGPRLAVVNAGPADAETTAGLLRLYPLFAPAAPAPAPREAARPAPREAARPAPREAARPAPREAARPRERATAPEAVALEAVKGRALRRALLGMPHDESLSLAAAALAAGRRLFSALKREAAAEAFAQAIALYDRHVAWVQARDALVAAHTYLLLCQHELGRKDAAKATAARLRELTGDHRPAGVPAATWEAYPLTPVPLLPRRVLEVKAPAGAKVYLDDQPVGTGAVTLHAGPGAHRVRVERAGHRVFVQEIPAGAAGAVLTASLVPEPEDAYADVRKALAELRKAGKPFAPEPYRALAKTVMVDLLLVAVREGAEVRLRWFVRALGRFAGASFTVPLPGAGAPAAATRTALGEALQRAREEASKDAALARQADEKGRKAEKTAKGPQIWKKWYFWVAAAVVAGVVAAFAIKDSTTEEKVILKITRP